MSSANLLIANPAGMVLVPLCNSSESPYIGNRCNGCSCLRPGPGRLHTLTNGKSNHYVDVVKRTREVSRMKRKLDNKLSSDSLRNESNRIRTTSKLESSNHLFGKEQNPNSEVCPWAHQREAAETRPESVTKSECRRLVPNDARSEILNFR